MQAPAWATAFSLVVLAGCASLDREECVSADWYSIGLEDGARGRAIERLGDHRRACAKHNIAPDGERYLIGRTEGLRSFCTYERGYAEGRAGHAYGAACPQPASFLAGYNRGREIHEVQRQLEQVEREVAQTRNALKEGIPEPRARARQIDRLEALTREAEQLEARVQDLERQR
ncbi:MAG TPA: DUF2799 domain-containing protein [Burkholderiales bacterium]|nr:DUF2799 domain-containing protein [Burkholderiales bacterium]